MKQTHVLYHHYLEYFWKNKAKCHPYALMYVDLRD